MAKTVEDLKKEIEDVENKIFHEELKDRINWDYYIQLERQKYELEKELSEVEKRGTV